MKEKAYCVVYSVTTSYDASVFARSKNEAIAKVKEVIGDPVDIEAAYEIEVPK